MRFGVPSAGTSQLATPMILSTGHAFPEAEKVAQSISRNAGESSDPLPDRSASASEFATPIPVLSAQQGHSAPRCLLLCSTPRRPGLSLTERREKHFGDFQTIQRCGSDFLEKLQREKQPLEGLRSRRGKHPEPPSPAHARESRPAAGACNSKLSNWLCPPGSCPQMRAAQKRVTLQRFGSPLRIGDVSYEQPHE